MSREKPLQPVRTYEGKKEDLRTYTDAQYVVDWLNAAREEPRRLVDLPAGPYTPKGELAPKLRRISKHRKRVLRLIAVLRELNSIASEGRDRAKGLPLSEEIRTLIKPLVRLQWKLVPAMETEEGLLLGWHLEQAAGDNLRFVLLCVARLSEHGLDWLRECSCGKWFLAYNRRSRFHSRQCKRRFELAQRKTPEGRENWKVYMQQLREAKAMLPRKQTKRRRKT